MYSWLTKSTFAKFKLVKNRVISWGNACSKTGSQLSLEFMPMLGSTLTCTVGWRIWSQDKNDNTSKTKKLDQEYFCMLTPVAMVYKIYFRTFSLTCTVWWSKWPTWPTKWPLNGESEAYRPEVNVVDHAKRSQRTKLFWIQVFSFWVIIIYVFRSHLPYNRANQG